MQRRLAQALTGDPELLTSGRPEGPRTVELLIRALQPHGGERLKLPRCARCGEAKPLPRTSGPKRLCANCGTQGRRDLPCAVCGKTLRVVTWDLQGQPRCQQHRPDYGGEAELICDIIDKLAPQRNRQELVSIIEQALKQPFQRRAAARELTERPALLTGEGAYGSTTTLILLGALVSNGVSGVVSPQCPFCARTVALKYRRGDARCCRQCYDAPRAAPCARCGRQGAVAGRTADGEPLCSTCDRRDPINHEACGKCGRLAQARRDEAGQPVCKRCWREPMATCSVCGDYKPCHFATSETPRCPNCTDRLHTEACTLCERQTTIFSRTLDGGAICEACGRRREPCTDCGKDKHVATRTNDGPLCSTCYAKNPLSFQPCVECGVVERLHHAGLCRECAAPRQLRSRLAGERRHHAPGTRRRGRGPGWQQRPVLAPVVGRPRPPPSPGRSGLDHRPRHTRGP